MYFILHTNDNKKKTKKKTHKQTPDILKLSFLFCFVFLHSLCEKQVLSQDNSFYHYITQSDCLREDLLNDLLPLLDDIYTFMSNFFYTSYFILLICFNETIHTCKYRLIDLNYFNTTKYKNNQLSTSKVTSASG